MTRPVQEETGCMMHLYIYIYRSSFHFPCRFSDFCNSNLDGGSFSPGGKFGVRQLLTCIQVVSLSAFASGWCLCRVCLKLSVYINLWYFWAFCAHHRPVPVQALGSLKQRAPEILPGFRRWNGGDGWIRLPERSSVTWFPAFSSIFTFKGPWIPWIGSKSTIHHSIFCGMSISASSWKMLPAILVTRKLGFWPIPELFFLKEEPSNLAAQPSLWPALLWGITIGWILRFITLDPSLIQSRQYNYTLLGIRDTNTNMIWFTYHIYIS